MPCHRLTAAILVARRTLAVAFAACIAVPATALADAPDPVPSATTGAAVQNADGSFTLTVSGQWVWPTHRSNCSTNRAGVGYAIGWNDPSQPGNVIENRNLTVAVGTPTDNIVHPVPPNPRDVSALSQFAAWAGGCGTFNGTFNTGTWGPISHTYPADHVGPFALCPIMYDVHGDGAGSPPNGVKEITAGGNGHNGDNSFEANNDTPLGNGCFTTTLARPIPGAPAPVVAPPAAQIPTNCLSLPTRLRLRAKKTSLVTVRVRVNGQNVVGALVRMTLPGGRVIFRRTGSDGTVRVYVRPSRSGTLVIQTSECSAARQVAVARARRAARPARYTG